jgi:hypothetical protein
MKISFEARRAAILAILLASSAAMADVVDTPMERRLFLTSGAPGVVVPRENWVITKEKRRPRGTGVYYALEDLRKQMIFSVFIEKPSNCQSSDACLDAATKNPAFKDAKEMHRTDEGPFKVAQFFLDQPRGLPVYQAQLLASAYVDGQWIDVRISRLGKERPDPSSLLALLRSLAIK